MDEHGEDKEEEGGIGEEEGELVEERHGCCLVSLVLFCKEVLSVIVCGMIELLKLDFQLTKMSFC